MEIENDPKFRWRVGRVLRETGRLEAMAIRVCEVFHDIAASREGCAIVPIKLKVWQMQIVTINQHA
jgi:hypothetical protein